MVLNVVGSNPINHPKIAGTMRIVPAILFSLRKLACRQREKNSRLNAVGVSCNLEQELHNGMDKRSAVNPIPEPKNCASLLAGRWKKAQRNILRDFIFTHIILPV